MYYHNHGIGVCIYVYKHMYGESLQRGMPDTVLWLSTPSSQFRWYSNFSFCIQECHSCAICGKHMTACSDNSGSHA